MAKLVSRVFAAGLLLIGLTGTAQAIPVTAHITADNHYGLYYGDATGSNMQYVGRNETGTSGNGLPGQYNWTLPETFNFNISAGDYLYVAAWDDGGPQMWTADFSWAGGSAPELVTDATNWQYIQGNTVILSELSSPPVTIPDLKAAITGASWSFISQALAYNSSPWGNISGVDDSAKFIWGDTTAEAGGKFQIFRTAIPVAPVPEPSTMLLLGAGLLGLAVMRRSRKA